MLPQQKKNSPHYRTLFATLRNTTNTRTKIRERRPFSRPPPLLPPQRRKNETVVVSHCTFLAHTGRRTRGKIKPACVPWENVYTSSSGCIGERHWRDIIVVAILCVRRIQNIFRSSHIYHRQMNALFAEPGDPRNALEHIEERLSHGRTTCCQWCEKKRDGRLSRRRRRVFVGVFLSFP